MSGDKKEEKKEAAPAEELTPEQEAAKKKKKLLIFAIIGAVLVLGGGAGAFFMMKGGKKNKETELKSDAVGKEAEKKEEKPKDNPDAAKDAPKEGDSKEGAKKEEPKPDDAKKDEKASGEKKEDEKKPAEAGGEKKADGKEEVVLDIDFGETYKLPPFSLNLGNALENRYIRIEIQLEYPRGNKKLKAEIEARQPQLRDAVIGIIQRKTREFLLSPDGKESLRREILKRINQYMSVPITNVYITDFLIE
jgi:flagellar FliL protein